MPIACYTCGEDIVFDKDIAVSKTGKPIPLWPDKQNTHSHDENGHPIRQELPADYKPKSKFAPTMQPKPFVPGAWRNQTNQQLDKNNTVTQTDNAVLIQRDIVLTQTLTKEFQQFRQQSFTAYEEIIKRLDKLEEAVAQILPTTLETAKEKYDREQNEIKEWDREKIPDDPNFSGNQEGEGSDNYHSDGVETE